MLKNNPFMRRTAAAAAVAVAVPMTITFGASAQAEPVSTSPSSNTVHTASSSSSAVGTTADGRALYRGLYFGQGPVAKKVSSLDSFSAMRHGASQNTASAKQTGNTALDAIQKRDPKFFSSFSRHMRSGDPFQVQSALSAGGENLKAVVKRTGSEDTGAAKGMCVTVAAVAVVAGVVTVAGAVNVAAAVNVAWTVNWFWSSAQPNSGSLGHEQEVASLTTALQPA